jgi:hypothetical protein
LTEVALADPVGSVAFEPPLKVRLNLVTVSSPSRRPYALRRRGRRIWRQQELRMIPSGLTGSHRHCSRLGDPCVTLGLRFESVDCADKVL